MAASNLAFNRTAQHEERLQGILDEAALLFNRKGYSGTTLDELAARLGLTKPALYYYVKGKEDLGYQSYLRTLDYQRSYIETADREAGTGLDAIALYIRKSCNATNRPAAIPTEVAALNDDRRDALGVLIRENTHALRRLIYRGVDDGSIAVSDPAIAALAIIGALSWVPQWYARDDAYSNDIRLEAIGAGLADIFLNGLCARSDGGCEPIKIPADDNALVRPMVFDRRQRTASKLDALLRAATEKFNSHGVNGTSLDQVVGALNVTKGAFYHHIRNKDDLLFRCYKRSLVLAEEFLAQAHERGGSGWERIASSIDLAIQTHCGPKGPLAIFIGIRDLSPLRQEAIARRAVQVHQQTRAFLQEGMADGSIRTFDIDQAHAAIVGATIWLPKWYHASGSWSAHDIANHFVKLLGKGLRKRG
ncbi:MAG: TetR family transcriptional regulator [Rhodospirillales bacterium]|nr:TetR family transcriptional regulator [Rhodospirillales bacterium]MCW8951432.1 TetR family transcriptional regulator [Rhodospirillales bacterium]